MADKVPLLRLLRKADRERLSPLGYVSGAVYQ